MTASLIGDGIFLVSLAWQVYELSNTPTALSIVGIAMTVPQIIFLLLGGVVSDRFDRRTRDDRRGCAPHGERCDPRGPVARRASSSCGTS